MGYIIQFPGAYASAGNRSLSFVDSEGFDKRNTPLPLAPESQWELEDFHDILERLQEYREAGYLPDTWSASTAIFHHFIPEKILGFASMHYERLIAHKATVVGHFDHIKRTEFVGISVYPDLGTAGSPRIGIHALRDSFRDRIESDIQAAGTLFCRSVFYQRRGMA